MKIGLYGEVELPKGLPTDQSHTLIIIIIYIKYVVFKFIYVGLERERRFQWEGALLGCTSATSRNAKLQSSLAGKNPVQFRGTAGQTFYLFSSL